MSAARRVFKRALLVLGAAAAAYAALLARPQPLFAYELRAGNVVLHARAPLPPRAMEIAEEARRRVAVSPFYAAGDTYHVFLCDTSALFAFFVPQACRVGGNADVYFSGNVFLRPARIERDRLVGYSGREPDGERTLTYFIAHEITHLMVAHRLGRWANFRLAAWQREGYADYVGKAGAFAFSRERDRFRANDPALDPARSGLYLRYHLLTAHLLDHKRLTPEALLAQPLAAEPLEEELRAR
ncbi:MAG TPA: hypothetical protein VF310_15595 [Vicinamibacteria bacterium]